MEIINKSTSSFTEFGDLTTETLLNAYNTVDKIKADITIKVILRNMKHEI